MGYIVRRVEVFPLQLTKKKKKKESEKQTFEIGSYSSIVPRCSTHERVQKV